MLVGRNPLDVVAICDDIADRLPWKGRPVLGSALAAINMALYDIAGKAWKAPVYQLLGGKKRDRIKIYNGGINFESVERARAEARAAVEAGAGGLKGNPLESRTWPMDHHALEHSAKVVAAVRKEVGPDVELMVDAHGKPESSAEHRICAHGGTLPSPVSRRAVQARLCGRSERDLGQKPSADCHR